MQIPDNLAYASRHLAKDHQNRARRSGDGRPSEDGLALPLVHVHQFVDEVADSGHDLVNGGTEIVAKGLRKQTGLILQVGQPALQRGVALVGFGFERGVLLPGAVRTLLGIGEQLVGIGGTEQSITQTNLLDAHLVQRLDSGDTLVIQFSNTGDEPLEHSNRVVAPCFDKLLLGHLAHGSKVRQRVPAGLGGDLHFDQRLGHSGAAHLRLDAHRRQGRCQSQNLGLCKSDLLASAGEAHGHLGDGALGGGEVVAQVDDGGAHVLEQALVRAHDVGELRQLGRGVVGVQVLTGVAQVDHDAGELRQMLVGDTQLTAGGHDLVDLGRRSGDLGGHLLGCFCQGRELFFCRVHGLTDGRERGLKIDGRINGILAKGNKRSGDVERQLLADTRCRLADRGQLLGEVGHGRARRCPARIRRPKPLLQLRDLCFCCLYGGFGVIQIGLRLYRRIGGILGGLLESTQLTLELLVLFFESRYFLAVGLVFILQAVQNIRFGAICITVLAAQLFDLLQVLGLVTDRLAELFMLLSALI